MLKSVYSVAMTTTIDAALTSHLIQHDEMDEDLIFALWTPSYGDKRLTALVHTLIYPEEGDRQRHGNASFNPAYYERVCRIAMQGGYGIAFLHSHPFPGWQHMSPDDVIAEKKMMSSTDALTGLPLLGMTVGSDATWSARFWIDIGDSHYERCWCQSVRIVGKSFHSHYSDELLPQPSFSEMFKRTITVWGEQNHMKIARLKIGIIGLGSVGSAVAANLARMGLTRLVFIDHDLIEPHNLDRLDYATRDDVGKLKVDVARERALLISTASAIDVDAVPHSITTEAGYRAALDCDVLFCCVDRPWPRAILNHIAYAHLIPVIDGGIDVRFKKGEFSGVDWQLQTVGPYRPCLECLGAFTWDHVSTEREGMLDNPSYIRGLPKEHLFRRNENVYPFSQNLASLEILQFIALTTSLAGISDFGVQRYRYSPGIVESNTEAICHSACNMNAMIATGDSKYFLHDS